VIPNPEEAAEIVIQRLIDAGFEIKAAEWPRPSLIVTAVRVLRVPRPTGRVPEPLLNDLGMDLRSEQVARVAVTQTMWG
jgi:hypothetical protein